MENKFYTNLPIGGQEYFPMDTWQAGNSNNNLKDQFNLLKEMSGEYHFLKNEQFVFK